MRINILKESIINLKKTFSFNCIVFSFLMIVLIYSTMQGQSEGIITISATIIVPSIMGFMSLTKYIKIRYRQIKIIIIWVFFSISLLVAGIITKNIGIGNLFNLIIIPLFYLFLIPNSMENRIQYILNLLSWLFFFIILYSIFFYSFTYPFKGVFKNENSMGMLGLWIIILRICYIQNYNKDRSIYNFFIIAISLIAILMSGSRTSLITTIIIGVLYFYIEIFIKNNIKKLFIIPILTGGVISIFYNKFIEITQGIIQKNTIAKKYNILSGREKIWRGIVNDANIFGNGDEYLRKIYGLGAHNSFLQILSTSGIICFVIYIILFIMILFYSIKNIKKDTTSLFINIGFLIVSMTETINMITSWQYHIFLLINGVYIMGITKNTYKTIF